MASIDVANVQVKCLRDCSSIVASRITYLVNLSLRKNIVPSDLKTARVISLF